MKALLIGIGAAGNKAVMTAINEKIVAVDDTLIVNSTRKDFPKDYTGKEIVLSATDTGCGKERSVSKEYTRKAISDGKFNFDNIADYTAVIIATSVEGGTGSGSTPIISKLFNQVYLRNTHVIAFTGFEDDVRGLSNTVEFLIKLFLLKLEIIRGELKSLQIEKWLQEFLLLQDRILLKVHRILMIQIFLNCQIHMDI